VVAQGMPVRKIADRLQVSTNADGFMAELTDCSGESAVVVAEPTVSGRMSIVPAGEMAVGTYRCGRTALG
jgi:hypothetical protein